MNDLALELGKANSCHDERGRFCEGSGDRRDFGALGILEQREAASDFLRKENKAWYKGITKTELTAVSEYTGSSYKEINTIARSNNPGGIWVDNLDKATTRYAISETVVVYRGFGPNTSERINGLTAGAELSDRGFVSTSLIPAVAHNIGANVHADEGARRLIGRITVPKGTKAAPIDGNSQHNEELEILLPRNSKFRVTGREDTRLAGLDVRYVNMELIP